MKCFLLVSLLLAGVICEREKTIKRAITIFKNRDKEVLDETLSANPDAQYDFSDDLRNEVDVDDAYDQLVPALPKFNVYKNHKNQGFTRVPIVTRRWNMWSTPSTRYQVNDGVWRTTPSFLLTTTQAPPPTKRTRAPSIITRAPVQPLLIYRNGRTRFFDRSLTTPSPIFAAALTFPTARRRLLTTSTEAPVTSMTTIPPPPPTDAEILKIGLTLDNNADFEDVTIEGAATTVTVPTQQENSAELQAVNTVDETPTTTTRAPTTRTSRTRPVFTRRSTTMRTTKTPRTTTAVSVTTVRPSIRSRRPFTREPATVVPDVTMRKVSGPVWRRGGVVWAESTTSRPFTPTMGRRRQWLISRQPGWEKKTTLEPVTLRRQLRDLRVATTERPAPAQPQPAFKPDPLPLAPQPAAAFIPQQTTHKPTNVQWVQPVSRFEYARLVKLQKLEREREMGGGKAQATQTQSQPVLSHTQSAQAPAQDEQMPQRQQSRDRQHNWQAAQHPVFATTARPFVRTTAEPGMTAVPKPVVIAHPEYRHHGPTFNCRVLNPLEDAHASPRHDATCEMSMPGFSADGSCRCLYEVAARDEYGCATGFTYSCQHLFKRN